MARTAKGEIIRAGRGAEKLGDWLNSNLDQVARALPRGIQADRLARVFVTEVQRTPGLLQCTNSSLLAGFLQASQCGLEIGAHLGQAYLVPFKVRGKATATLIIGYKGLVALAYNSGLVSNVQAWDVREADRFEPPTLGTEPKIVHSPARGRESSEVEAAYAIVRLRDSRIPNLEWMWRDELDAIMKRSRAAASKSSPWHTDYPMMARKTALRRACKYIPQTTETRQLHSAVIIDEQADANLVQTFDIDPASLSDVVDDYDPEAGELSPDEEKQMGGAS